MRPINKGESPYKKINEYKDALPYLERRIGMYCSYCEFSIPHVPEVEHVVSKSKGGDLTDWKCSSCGGKIIPLPTEQHFIKPKPHMLC